MQARAPLMIEHRLIERMLSVVGNVLKAIDSGRPVDPAFIDIAVDSIRIDADRTHHGKEEDILFRELEGKNMSAEHRRMMNELIEDHVFGRRTTQVLVAADERYSNGEDSAIEDIAGLLRTLAEFYPEHIRKEDKEFFPAFQCYLKDEEDQELLAEFRKIDQQMIHEEYKSLVIGLETGESRYSPDVKGLGTRLNNIKEAAQATLIDALEQGFGPSRGEGR